MDMLKSTMVRKMNVVWRQAGGVEVGVKEVKWTTIDERKEQQSQDQRVQRPYKTQALKRNWRINLKAIQIDDLLPVFIPSSYIYLSDPDSSLYNNDSQGPSFTSHRSRIEAKKKQYLLLHPNK